MYLQDTLKTSFFNLPDGYHDILPDYIDSEFVEAYEGLTGSFSPPKLLQFKVANGTVEAAYKANLGLSADNLPVLRIGREEMPIEDPIVKVPGCFVYVNTADKPPEGELMVTVSVEDLLPLRPISEGEPSNLQSVRSGYVPDGAYKILSKKTVPSSYGGTFVAAVLESAQAVKLVHGQVYDPESKCKVPGYKPGLQVNTFSTTLPGSFARDSVQFVTFEGYTGKAADSRPKIGARPKDIDAFDIPF
jgi:hypothetical protein